MKRLFLIAIAFCLNANAADNFVGTWKLTKEYCGPRGAPPEKVYEKYELTLNKDGSFSEAGIFDKCSFRRDGNYTIENGSELFLVENSSVDCNGVRSPITRINNIVSACRLNLCIQIYNARSPGCSSRVYMQVLN